MTSQFQTFANMVGANQDGANQAGANQKGVSAALLAQVAAVALTYMAGKAEGKKHAEMSEIILGQLATTNKKDKLYVLRNLGQLVAAKLPADYLKGFRNAKADEPVILAKWATLSTLPPPPLVQKLAERYATISPERQAHDVLTASLVASYGTLDKLQVAMQPQKAAAKDSQSVADRIAALLNKSIGSNATEPMSERDILALTERMVRAMETPAIMKLADTIVDILAKRVVVSQFGV